MFWSSRNNVSVNQVKLDLNAFSDFNYKLENFYHNLRKDLDDNFKDVLNELLLKIDSTQVLSGYNI